MFIIYTIRGITPTNIYYKRQKIISDITEKSNDTLSGSVRERLGAMLREHRLGRAIELELRADSTEDPFTAAKLYGRAADKARLINDKQIELRVVGAGSWKLEKFAIEINEDFGTDKSANKKLNMFAFVARVDAANMLYETKEPMYHKKITELIRSAQEDLKVAKSSTKSSSADAFPLTPLFRSIDLVSGQEFSVLSAESIMIMDAFATFRHLQRDFNIG